MTYERPDIQLRYGVHAPGGQTISKPLDKPSGMNLRPRESKEFTDSNARRDLNPSAVSKQVVLPRCARHPHWVAGGSTGKAINGYVKEAVKWCRTIASYKHSRRNGEKSFRESLEAAPIESFCAQRFRGRPTALVAHRRLGKGTESI
jgi:hypothetical protein